MTRATFIRRRWSWLGSSTLIVLAGLLAVLSQHYRVSIDLTQNHQNSLSAGELNILQAFQTPVTIEAIVKNKPELKRRITHFLTPYLQAQPLLTLKMDTLEQQTEQLQLDQRGRIVLQYQGREIRLYQLERRAFVAALQKLIHTSEQWIVFLEGHGEKSLFDRSNNGYSLLLSLLKKNGYQVQALDLLRLPAIPDNTAVLVLAGPTEDLRPTEVAELQRYLNQGGRLLWLQEPVVLNALQPLARTLGIHFLPGIVVSANKRLQQMLGIRHPAVLAITDLAQHPITANLNGRLLLPLAAALQTMDNPAWASAPLFFSPSDSWNETDDLQAHVRFDHPPEEQAGPLTLATALTAKETHPAARAVIIGDSDFLDNDYLAKARNAAFVLSVLAWLTEVNEPHPLVAAQVDLGSTITMATLQWRAAVLLLGIPTLLASVGIWLWIRGRRHA